MSGRQPGMLDASRTDPPDLERIRRLAKQWAGRRRRLTRSAMEDFTDIYMIILGTAIVVMMTIQGLGVMGSTGSAAPSGSARLVPGDAVGQPVWLAVGAVIALIAIGLGPLRRLGPLFLRPEQAQWWLPLPGDRSALLRRLARRELAVVWALSSAAGAVIALIERSGVLGAARWSVLVGGVAGLSLAALLAAQAHGGPVVVVRARTTALSAAGACAGASLLSPLSDAHAALVPVIIGAVLVLATAIWWRRGPGRHLAELDDDSLLQASARAFGAHAAALAMDTRALGRMISSPPRRPTRPAGLRLARVCVRLPGALRTVLGVGAVDWLAPGAPALAPRTGRRERAARRRRRRHDLVGARHRGRVRDGRVVRRARGRRARAPRPCGSRPRRVVGRAPGVGARRAPARAHRGHAPVGAEHMGRARPPGGTRAGRREHAPPRDRMRGRLGWGGAPIGLPSGSRLLDADPHTAGGDTRRGGGDGRLRS